MLPLQQAYEVKYSILEYLKATFSFKDKALHKAFYRFLDDEHDGIFKGPYISLKTPFVKAAVDDAIPLEIRPQLIPYDHQYKAFQRLTTEGGHQPEPTLITTGTSSGKTESFMYPMLDYCHKNIHRRGIKVIILYPMNALATDQAKRLAEAIWNEPLIKGKVTAGLFIGEGKNKSIYPNTMGETHIIEQRNSIIDSPPDILLTNFKMLDFALMKGMFHNLWAFNFQDPSLLQFLVLDELHTYDGAQGTDVANLIRRLKLKLDIPRGQICPVGTSATIGSGVESIQLLTEYASKVFGEEIDTSAIITENRLTAEAYMDVPNDQVENYIPRLTGLLESRLKADETYETYIARQKRLWQIPGDTTSEQLGTELKKIQLLQDIVSVTSQKLVTIHDLIREVGNLNADFRQRPEWDEANGLSPKEEVIQSLLALISEAKNGRTPFLYLQVQIWVRELGGILRNIDAAPSFTWKDKVADIKDHVALPSWFCRECGSSGWLGVKDDNKNHFYSDPNQVYEYFFSNHKNLYFIQTADQKYIDEYEPSNFINGHLHLNDLSIHDKASKDSIHISAVRKLKELKSRHICPQCNTENSIGVIGTRIATMSSVTVSQSLSSDLDPRKDKYRKILVFTNSVQDAAHQAGFIEARNYRFTFRASLQKIINQTEGLTSLAELQNLFLFHWKSHADTTGIDHEQAYFYRFFPADYKNKADLATDYRVGKMFSDEFKKEFDNRMKWEIISEFGYNATIGRTLEKSGASGVMFDSKALHNVFDKMQPWLTDNNLAIIQASEFVPFLNGVLHRIRMRGGVDHIYLKKFRSVLLKRWDLNWNKDPRHFLNYYFGSRARLPKLITTDPHQKGLLDTTFTNSNNWYRNYFTKNFQMAGNYPAMVNDFYKKLMEVLVENGIMNQDGQEYINLAIEPTAIWVEKIVTPHECDQCGSMLYVAASDDISGQTQCLDYSCKNGVYKAVTNHKQNYYQLVYNRNRSPRIYAAEHTGMLERKDREDKEIDFKERPKFNSLNTLVATSTLEMGIDIGTLNTAINNSVPPLPSNFLQRIGRAGRSSGSALVINFAVSQPHDLYYYEEPLDMMQGEISTPGCFLEAKEILFRHFFAYCLDNWTSADHKVNVMPGQLLYMKLSHTDLNAPEFFINRVISFIKANEQVLLNRFIEFYAFDLQQSNVLDELKRYLQGEQFYIRLKAVFQRLKDEYLFIIEKRNEIEKIIKDNKLGKSDEERTLLNEEAKALYGLKRILDKRAVLEHLTNVGLLPNYAFPETGVTLNAWIKSGKAKASNSSPKDKGMDIVRPASTAIRELAPGNFFYSQGYKMEISGLNTYDWKDPGTLLLKRFCSNCDHLADDAVSKEAACPKCGDTSWSSIRNVHRFVKITGVKSISTRENATLDDKSDERDALYYRVSRHVKFDQNSFQGAWGMKEIPFGIEYVKNVDITEVNIGLSTAVDANKIKINQHEDIPFHGFITCKSCGKSTSEPHKVRSNDKLSFHYGYCKHKDKPYSPETKDIFEEVYLFREIKTEALKVLLPVQEFEGEAQVKMFKAGLELGLKKYYGGNPQHIHIMEYSEFNGHTAKFDRYLIMYDTIPGGTGYLEKLFDFSEFSIVLQKAYEAIKECKCQYVEKDGCYRCIYTYSNQRTQKELSRNKAEKLFKKIMDQSQSWERYPTGLGSLSGTGQIEESELEDRFIRSLRNCAQSKKDLGWLFENETVDGVQEYRMRLVNHDITYHYYIRPQYELGPSHGVQYVTRADFYISLVSATKNGHDISSDEIPDFGKDIAIYMDGYHFHASAEHQRFNNDVQKRLGILASEKIYTWTLTWHDLEIFDNNIQNSEKLKDSVAGDYVRYKNTHDKLKQLPFWNIYKSEILSASDSMERLLFFLLHPLPKDAVEKKVALHLLTFCKNLGQPSADVKDIETIFSKPWESLESGLSATDKKDGNFYILTDVNDHSWDFASIRFGIRLKDLQKKVSLFLQEKQGALDKSEWESFWQFFNLVQSDIELITTRSPELGIEADTVGPSYDCLAYFDHQLHEVVKIFIDHGLTFDPEGLFYIEYMGEYAEAQLGLHDQKIFFLPYSDHNRDIFLKAGYTEGSLQFTVGSGQ